MHITRRSLLYTAGALATPFVANAAERTRITLWHAMGATPGDEINKLMAAFNASQDKVEVTGRNRGKTPG